MSSSYPEVLKIEAQATQLDDALSKEVAIQQETISLPPPSLKDGGFRAWLQVVGCFLVFFNVW